MLEVEKTILKNLDGSHVRTEFSRLGEGSQETGLGLQSEGNGVAGVG